MSAQTEQNKALMAKVAAAFKEGDIRLLKESIADDVSWKSTSPASLFRFGGEHFNRTGVTDLLALLFVSYLFRRFDPKESLPRTTWFGVCSKWKPFIFRPGRRYGPTSPFVGGFVMGR